MSLDIKLLTLLESKSLRSELKDDEIIQEIESCHDLFGEYIKKEKDIMELEAIVLCYKFWVVNEAMCQIEDVKHGFYGTRVRRREGSITMEWFRTVAIQGGQPIRQSLKMDGSSKRHLKSQFSKAADWEWEIINAVESAYARIRVSLVELDNLKKEKTAMRKGRLVRLKRTFASM